MRRRAPNQSGELEQRVVALDDAHVGLGDLLEEGQLQRLRDALDGSMG